MCNLIPSNQTNTINLTNLSLKSQKKMEWQLNFMEDFHQKMKNPRNYNDLMHNSRSQNNKSQSKQTKKIKLNESFIEDMTSQKSIQENPITENTLTLTQSLAQGDVNSLKVDFIHKIHRNPFVQPYLKQVISLTLTFQDFPDAVKSQTK